MLVQLFGQHPQIQGNSRWSFLTSGWLFQPSNISYEAILEIRQWHWGKLNGIVTTDVVETILSQASPREEGAEHRWGRGDSFLESS